MDLFNSQKNKSKSLNILMKSKLEDIHLNYQTLSEYSWRVAEKQVRDRANLIFEYSKGESANTQSFLRANNNRFNI